MKNKSEIINKVQEIANKFIIKLAINNLTKEKALEYLGLNISQRLSLEDLKKAYKTKIKQNHPDLNKNDPLAHHKTQLINAAYDFLKNYSFNENFEDFEDFEYSDDKESNLYIVSMSTCYPTKDGRTYIDGVFRSWDEYHKHLPREKHLRTQYSKTIEDAINYINKEMNKSRERVFSLYKRDSIDEFYTNIRYDWIEKRWYTYDPRMNNAHLETEKKNFHPNWDDFARELLQKSIL